MTEDQEERIAKLEAEVQLLKELLNWYVDRRGMGELPYVRIAVGDVKEETMIPPELVAHFL